MKNFDPIGKLTKKGGGGFQNEDYENKFTTLNGFYFQNQLASASQSS